MKNWFLGVLALGFAILAPTLAVKLPSNFMGGQVDTPCRAAIMLIFLALAVIAYLCQRQIWDEQEQRYQ